ncbi:MAG: hypothetical protein WHS65_12785 [Melioribacteraceae bacterium]
MELKIKIAKGNYALRTFDKDGNEIFYTSTRIGGIQFDKDSLSCSIPDLSVTYELKNLDNGNTKKGNVKGEKNVSD